jgi:hypothetical protein
MCGDLATTMLRQSLPPDDSVGGAASARIDADAMGSERGDDAVGVGRVLRGLRGFTQAYVLYEARAPGSNGPSSVEAGSTAPSSVGLSLDAFAVSSAHCVQCVARGCSSTAAGASAAGDVPFFRPAQYYHDLPALCRALATVAQAQPVRRCPGAAASLCRC